MIDFKVQSLGIQEAIAKVQAIAPKQLPFILALSLTETARDVEFIMKRAMQSDIDRPRDFTINSLFSTRATKQNLEASVQWKDYASGGTAAGKYLRPIAEGGSRQLKRSESSLKRMGLLPAGYFLTPGRDAQLDQNGNIPGQVFVQMLSALRAFGEAGYTANKRQKQQEASYNRRARKAFQTGEVLQAQKANQTPWFIILPGSSSRLAPGIYKRLKTKRQLIFAIVRSPRYKISFPFTDIATKAAKERMPIQFDAAIVKAMATAKP
jgi:hypothetical protein